MVQELILTGETSRVRPCWAPAVASLPRCVEPTAPGCSPPERRTGLISCVPPPPCVGAPREPVVSARHPSDGSPQVKQPCFRRKTQFIFAHVGIMDSKDMNNSSLHLLSSSDSLGSEEMAELILCFNVTKNKSDSGVLEPPSRSCGMLAGGCGETSRSHPSPRPYPSIAGGWTTPWGRQVVGTQPSPRPTAPAAPTPQKQPCWLPVLLQTHSGSCSPGRPVECFRHLRVAVASEHQDSGTLVFHSTGLPLDELCTQEQVTRA